jgi:hypothetical protein
MFDPSADSDPISSLFTPKCKIKTNKQSIYAEIKNSKFTKDFSYNHF